MGIWPLHLISQVTLNLQIGEGVHTRQFWLLLWLNWGLCHWDRSFLGLPQIICSVVQQFFSRCICWLLKKYRVIAWLLDCRPLNWLRYIFWLECLLVQLNLC